MAKPSSNTNTVFIDTNLNTHLAFIVSHNDTVSHLKKKLLFEHSSCFPSIGDVKINAVKVKRRGHFYHLSDSMLVKSAFYGIDKCWFLLVDVDAASARERVECRLPLDSSRDVSKSGKLEGERDNGNYCNQSITGTDNRLGPGVEEKIVRGRAKEITGIVDDCRRSDPVVDDAIDLINGAVSSGKDTTFEVGKMKNDVFDNVVDTRYKRSVEPPKSSRPAKKRKTKRKSDLEDSLKERETSFIEDNKKASELDVTISQHPSENDQKSKDVKGKRKKKKSLRPQNYVVSAVPSSGIAGTVHEDAEEKPDSSPFIEKDIQAVDQSEVQSCVLTVKSKQSEPVEKFGIFELSSLSRDVKEKSVYAVEGVQSLKGDDVIIGKDRLPVDNEDGNNQKLQNGASRNEKVILNDNCDSPSHQTGGIEMERELLEETGHRLTEAEMLRPSTPEEGKAQLAKTVAPAMVPVATDVAGQRESMKKRKKLRGSQKSIKDATTADSEFVDSSLGAQSLKDDGIINDKGQPSVNIEDAINYNQLAGASRGENGILNSNCNNVSDHVDIKKERELRPSTHEEGKTPLEKSSEMAEQKKSTKNRKKIKGTKKSTEVAKIAAVGKAVNSLVEGVHSLDNGLINSKGQASAHVKDAKSCDLPIGVSVGEDIILNDDYNSISHPMDNIGKEGELLYHRSTAAKTQDEGKRLLKTSVVPSKILDAGEVIGQKESTKKRKKRKEIKESNEEATLAAVVECIERANVVSDGHGNGITQKNSCIIEIPVKSHAANIEGSLQPVTNDGTVDGIKTGDEIFCGSDGINFKDHFVPKQHPNEAGAAADEVTTSIKSAKKNKKKQAMHSEDASDLQSLPKSNHNENREEEVQVRESNITQHHGSSSKDDHNEFTRPSGKRLSENSVKGAKVQASSNSNKPPYLSGKSKKPSANKYAIDLGNGTYFSTPHSSLDNSKRVTKLIKKHNDAARISSGKNNGVAVNGSDYEKSMLENSGRSVWEESSEGEESTDNSDSSTSTPSDNNSLSSADSDGESTATLNTPQTGPLYSKGKKDGGDKSAKLGSMAQKSMNMDKILRSSSRYKRAKLTASQSEIEDTESQPVPDTVKSMTTELNRRPQVTASERA